MKKKIVLLLVTLLIASGLLVACGNKSTAATNDQVSNLNKIGTALDDSLVITTYEDKEHNKIVYVVRNKNNNAGTSISVVDIK